MTIASPMFVEDLQYPAWMLRRMFAAQQTAGVVVPSTQFLVTPSTGLQVNISAGDAFVAQTVESQESSSADEGLYYVYNDGPVNPANTVLAPVTYNRVDQIILRVYDVQELGTSGSSYARIEWLQGTETSGATLINLSGAASTLPANSLRLAYVLQTPGETSIPGGNILQAAPTSGPKSGPASALSTGQTFAQPSVGSFSLLTSATLTLVCTGAPVLIMAGPMQIRFTAAPIQNYQVGFGIDGASPVNPGICSITNPGSGGSSPTESVSLPFTPIAFLTPSAGTHTFNVYSSLSGNTAVLDSYTGTFLAVNL